MSEKVNTKRSWWLALFGLPFVLAGAGFLSWSVIPTLYDGWQMQSWGSVQGQLTSARQTSSTSDGSTSYGVEAAYRYTISGRSYQNDRVAISSGKDNIGDFQQQLGRKLTQQFHNQSPVAVWYNPTNPAASILNRDIRWGLLVFKMVFVIIFAGIGLGIIIFALRGKQVVDAAEAIERPWLARKEWKDGVIRSGAKGGMYGVWGFAIFWNLISFPIAIMAVPEMLAKKEYEGLFVLLFPLVGLGLLYWAIKVTMEWKRFGATPLTMDPFPGSVGADVGGSVRVNMLYNSSAVYKVTLGCIHSYISGSGKNRSRKESVKWQEEGYARVRPMGSGVDVQFRFEVPSDLPVSEEYSDSYNLWRLTLEADIPGIDLDRMFEIPVYATGEKSRRLNFNSVKEQPAGVAKITAESLLPLRRSGIGKELYYPMLRKPGGSLMGVIFGGIFAGAGIFMWMEAARAGFMLYFMSSVFSLVGWGIVLFVVYSALSSRRITFDGRTISRKKSLLGISVANTSVAYTDILSVQAEKGLQSNTGKKHTIEYKVLAKLPGEEIVLAEHLDSSAKRNIVVAYFEEEFNLADAGSDSGSRFEL